MRTEFPLAPIMHSKLIDTLREIDYPITILSNFPESDIDQGHSEWNKLLAQSDHNHSVSLEPDYENTAPWDDKVLETVTKGNGLLVMNIQYEADTWNFISVAVYTPEEVSKLRVKKNIGLMLYARCHMMSDASEPIPQSDASEIPQTKTSSLTPDEKTLEEITYLNIDHCLFSSESTAVYFFKGREAPAVLNLIGIGRAITFAAIGAGSGQEIDLFPEDQYYDHIMLWDKKVQSLIGAYRIGFTEEIIEEIGTHGLYLDHVFNFEPTFHEQLGNAMELSRSFILPSYQKNPQMLDALWKGLAQAAISKNCYTMYGSVTISASFTPLSQAILVDTIDRYYSEVPSLRSLVRSKNPFVPITKNHSLVTDTWASLGINRLNSVIEDLENNQRSIPPLIRYYVALGAKFLSFQVEASFNDAIYCLLRVDLKSLPKRYKRRFLGE